jgi:excisionase family DNA binding protein
MSSDQRKSSKSTLEPTEWISQAAAARLRNTTRQAVADLVAKGRLATLEIGGKVLVKRSDVEGFKPKRPGPAPKKRRSDTSERAVRDVKRQRK